MGNTEAPEMIHTPPQGSLITLDTQNGHSLVVVPHSQAGTLRGFVGVFLLVWLLGWFAALVGVFSQIAAGKYNMVVIILWLIAWIIGGTLAINLTYRVFRKSLPEQILLNQPYLSIDTGMPLFTVGLDVRNVQKYWQTMYHKRRYIEFSPSEVATITLRTTHGSNQLTIDQADERIELATGVSAAERVWLYQYLQRHYDVSVY